MKRTLAAIAACFVVGAAQPADAWGAPGHLLIGGLAEQQLNPNARAQLELLLAGFPVVNPGHPDLGSAAVWADCVRDVSKTGDVYNYQTSNYTPDACKQFDAAEIAHMVDYAKRNWTQCDYYKGCHAAYHFADVAIQNSAYDPTHSLVGTSDHDVVSAIQAAILVLQGSPSPAPFMIKDKREAAILLAHFVGDLHQPLHVGAVYLYNNGHLRNPGDNPEDAADRNSETRGGNVLKFGSSSNLHGRWDDVSATWAVMSQAHDIPATPGSVNGWPVIWANETVLQSHGAYANLTYSKVMLDSDGDRYWIAQFANQTTYANDRRDMQALQVARAAARLAAIYNAIWP